MNKQYQTATIAPDLRRVGSHPDHWYPLAWSDDLQARQGARAALRRRADRPVRTRPESCSRSRTAARTARCRCIMGVVSGEDSAALPRLDLRRHRRAVPMFPISARAGCRTACGYPVPRGRRPRLRLPGRRELAEQRRLPDARARSPTPLQDPAVRPRGRLPLHVHAREPDGHEPSVPAPRRRWGRSAHATSAAASGDDWVEVDYSFAAPAASPRWASA